MRAEGGDGGINAEAIEGILALAAGEAEDGQVGERSAKEVAGFAWVEPDGLGIGVFIAPSERDGVIECSVFGEFGDLGGFSEGGRECGFGGGCEDLLFGHGVRRKKAAEKRAWAATM